MEHMGFEILDPEWAGDLQSGLESYMEYLYASLDADLDSPEAEVQTATGEPFCACHVCETRELLAFIVPRAIDGYLKGAIKLSNPSGLDHS
jgi:hypothetical protein